MSILIDEGSKFIIQGITGREAVTMAKELIDYGSKLVGREVHGVPVEDTVKAFTDNQKIDGSIIVVPPAFTTDAVMEALDAGIKLIVVVTERIPRKQVAQFVEFAQQQNARIIGPNCLGIISPGKSKMGGIGGSAEATKRAFVPGNIGIMSRSGGMTVEIANSLSSSGLGVSTAISIGGDVIIGSSYAELMPLFDQDNDTKGIAIYSEPGGRAEILLAEYVKKSNRKLPIVAFMAGKFMDAMPGMRFGHAGTIVEKIIRMQEAGITVVERIEEIPMKLKELIS
jgi:succinyl-CoA synthetase alpha subunit